MAVLTQRVASIVFFLAAASAALGAETVSRQEGKTAVSTASPSPGRSRRLQRRLELVDEAEAEAVDDNRVGRGPGVEYLPPTAPAKFVASQPERSSRTGWRPLVSGTPAYAEPLLSPLAFRHPGHRVPSQLLLPPRGTYSQPYLDRSPFREELYRYRIPGPSPTEPFWEELDRRRQRLLLGFSDEELSEDPRTGCRCGLARSRRPSEQLVDFLGDSRRLGSYGVGAFGLYGWNQPKHYHNSVPLGAGIGRNHDSPN